MTDKEEIERICAERDAWYRNAAEVLGMWSPEGVYDPKEILTAIHRLLRERDEEVERLTRDRLVNEREERYARVLTELHNVEGEREALRESFRVDVQRERQLRLAAESRNTETVREAVLEAARVRLGRLPPAP